MATRFYLGSEPFWRVGSTTHGDEPPLDVSWATEILYGVQQRRLVPRKTFPRPFYAYSVTAVGTATNSAYAQWVSPPLAAQTISGTIKGMIRTRENFASDNVMAQMCLRVFSNDCLTLKGVLLPTHTLALASEFAVGTLTNRKFPVGWTGSGDALSSLAVDDGDRLVLEIGHRAHSAAGTGFFELGCLSDTDLAENETDTLQYNPWIELSHDVTWSDPAMVLVSTKEDKFSELGVPALEMKPQGVYAETGIAGQRDDLDPLFTDLARSRAVDLTVNLTPPSVTMYYKMRAQDSGVPAPGYVTWVSVGSPDFAGVGYPGGAPTPVGTMVVGSATVAARWEG